MKLKFKKGVGILCATAMLAVALVGCGSKSMEQKPNETAAKTSEVAEAKKEKVTLRFSWWGSDARHQATLDAIEAYTALNPHVTIEGEYQGYDGYQQKILTQLVGGTAPDLMQLDYPWLADLDADGDAFVDLSKESVIDLSQFSQSIIEEYCSINGKVVALPMGTNGYGIMINKAFFDKHGLDVATEWTWEKIIEVGTKINQESPDDHLFVLEPGTTTGGLGEFVLGMYIYNKTGEYWVQDSPAQIIASKEDLLAGLTMMEKLFNSGAAQPLGDAALFNSKMEQNPKWINGQMGMTIDWSSTVSKYRDAAGAENFTVGKPITVEGGENKEVKVKPSMILSVNNQSAHKEEALAFANWMMNDAEAVKILKDVRSVPTSNIAMETLEAADLVDPLVAIMVKDTLENPADAPPVIQNNPEIADVIRDVCERVIYRRVTPEEGVEELFKRVEDKFLELK